MENHRTNRSAGLRTGSVVRPCPVLVAGRSRATRTESWSLEGGNDLKVARRNEMTNRTTRPKRRQGTVWAAGRSHTLPKRFSPENYLPAVWGRRILTGTQHGEARYWRGTRRPAGVKESRTHREKSQEPGRPLCLPAGSRKTVASGERLTNERRQPDGFRRGESDRPIVGRGKRPASSREPDPCRRGRQNNAARKGNMDWKE